MDAIEEKNQEEIRTEAKILAYKWDRLIQNCDSWLSEEEGRKNVHLRWVAREKDRRKMRRRKFMNGVFKLVGVKKRYPIDETVFLAWYE
ncbi:MAG: hypothetical protein FWF09_05810 [Bacteroidales bacterium]|nr:hypothetical protein [Bacteroidales bacterium]